MIHFNFTVSEEEAELIFDSIYSELVNTNIHVQSVMFEENGDYVNKLHRKVKLLVDLTSKMTNTKE